MHPKPASARRIGRVHHRAGKFLLYTLYAARQLDRHVLAQSFALWPRPAFSSAGGRSPSPARPGGLVFLLVFPVFAQEAPKPLPIDDKAPHANEWRGARDRLHQKQSELFNLINQYRGHGDFTKADLALSAKSHEPIFAAWQKVFSAYEGGKLEEAWPWPRRPKSVGGN